MEENKIVGTEVPQGKKLTYEELETLAHQLNEQIMQLYKKLQESDREYLFNRLHFLFKVLKYKDSFDKEFVDNIAKEVVELMTIPKDTTEKE